MTPEQDDYLADDGEDQSASRSLLSAGWLRALLVLGALAVVIVITIPYFLQWLETGSSERPMMTDAQIARPMPAPPTRIETAPAPAPMPAPEPAASSAPAPAAVTPPAQTAKESPITKEPSTAKEASPAKEASAAKEMPAAKEPAKALAAAPRTPPPSKVGTTTPPVAKDVPVSQQTAKAPTVAARAAAPASAAPTKSMDGSSSYWVQVGLFESAANAERLAQGLRTDRFSVQVAQVSRGSGTPAAARHELFVTGSSVDAVSAALKGSGTAQAVPGGVRIQPSLDLKDAVTLSRRLASEGLEVRIRRAGSAAAGGAATVHLVRVGGYATPAEAQAGKKTLAAKGIAGFVTQGAPK